jgi:hypothetical protein
VKFAGFSNFVTRPWINETDFYALFWVTNGDYRLVGVSAYVSEKMDGEWQIVGVGEYDRGMLSSGRRDGEGFMITFGISEPTPPLRVVMEVTDYPTRRPPMSHRLRMWYCELMNRPKPRVHFERHYSVTNEFHPKP